MKNNDINQYSQVIQNSLEAVSTIENYNQWIHEMIIGHAGRRVVEVGSGIGNITQFLTGCEHVDCVEPEPEMMEVLKKAFPGRPNLSFHTHLLEDCDETVITPNSADTVICLNVLEHIPDDLSAVKKMKSFLAPGGKVIIFVPAMHLLYSNYDRMLGHCRRYDKKNLRRLFDAAGLDVISLKYVNLVGSFGWFFNFCLLKHTRISMRSVSIYNRLVPTIKFFEKLVPPPFGQSILGIARNP